MNERIQQLAQQAGAELYGEQDILVNGKDANDFVENFAQLIIQECANFIKEWERYQLDMADQCNGHFPTGGAGELKQHFGVEL